MPGIDKTIALTFCTIFHNVTLLPKQAKETACLH